MLEVMGLDNEIRWQEIVESFHDYDVYYLPQYTKAFLAHGDGEPLLFYFHSGDTKAINVVMKRDIAQCGYFSGNLEAGKYFDLTTPYGYGGFYMEGNRDHKTLGELNEAYSNYCTEHNFVGEFVRFHPLLKNHLGLENMYEIVELGKTVCMDLSSPKAIYENINPKTRNKLRKAQSYGVEVRFGSSEDLYGVFKEIYDETMDRNEAESYYYFGKGFYDSIRTDLENHSFIVYSVLQEEIVAVRIVLTCNRYMHIHLGGSRSEYSFLAPVVPMYYETALWGYQNGYKSLYLGGGVGSSDDSLYKFKSNFNKNDAGNRFVIGKKIFNAAAYSYLLDLRKQHATSMKPGFFPGYRA